MRKFLLFAALGLALASCETSETPATEGTVQDSTAVETVAPVDVTTATDATVEPVPMQN